MCITISRPTAMRLAFGLSSAMIALVCQNAWAESSRPAENCLVSKVPVIMENPKSQSVPTGSSVNFLVRARGENLHYRWYLNDVAQENLDVNEVTIPQAMPKHHGSRIYVVVSNAFGSVTSKEASLSVITTPVTPKITTFKALPSTITQGKSTRLDWIFCGGQGVITPGNIVVEARSSLTVSPMATTTYNLTVTSPEGKKVTTDTTVTVLRQPCLAEETFGDNESTSLEAAFPEEQE